MILLNFAKTLKRVLKSHSTKGINLKELKILSILKGIYNYFSGKNKDLKDDRLTTCTACPKLSYDHEWYCGECECTLLYKASNEKEECPLGYWMK